MKSGVLALDRSERISAELRTLYASFGYQRYKMGKFEEYDLYGRNKDFLVSKELITFTDRSGKLMALKPDVTLSIIKNCDVSAQTAQKLYYNENVYRVSKGSGMFREILQTGLECFGRVDDCAEGEVLYLAAKSLSMLSKEFVLDVSHLGLTGAAVSLITDDEKIKEELFRRIGEKNEHGILEICRSEGIKEEAAKPLVELLSLRGNCKKVLSALPAIAKTAGPGGLRAAEELCRTLKVFEGSELEGCVNVDFSVVSNRAFYSGVVFQGFVAGAAESVLFGGRYDRLTARMQKSAEAIGFAVYLDRLERVGAQKKEYDADLLLVYGENESPAKLREVMEDLTSKGLRVFASPTENVKIRCKKKAFLENGEVKESG